MPIRVNRLRRCLRFERENQRQGHLAFLQIAEHRLSELFVRCGEIERIIDELEGQPRVAPVFRERFLDYFRLLAEYGPEPRAAAEEAGRLAEGQLGGFRLIQI